MEYTLILVDEPGPGIRRITLNRPEKRNALNHTIRGELLHALETGDADPDVRVQIVRVTPSAPVAASSFSLGSPELKTTSS